MKITLQGLAATTVLSIPGAILGSALWEGGLRSVLARAALGVVEVTTLGVDALIDSVYADVGRGAQDYLVQFILLIVFSCSMGIALGVITELLFMSNPRFAAIRRGVVPVNKATKILSYLIISGSIFIFVFTNRAFYVSVLMNDFNRYIAIISPYVDEKQRLLLISDLRQVKTKNDARKIADRISVVLKANSLPDHSIPLL